ncbi:hypothetical protein E2C01_031217 [Portunus trituberculatus]|uniref:Uncharacterized protein n=1 Tax=Portunus trituberculatus TaxID=210409 RepID=A0A5B7EX32_PORTR|nr:hypothetical protein [Portunus trituberculatus]
MKWICGFLVCLVKEFRSVVQLPVLLIHATMVVPAFLALPCGPASVQKGTRESCVNMLSVKELLVPVIVAGVFLLPTALSASALVNGMVFIVTWVNKVYMLK